MPTSVLGGGGQLQTLRLEKADSCGRQAPMLAPSATALKLRLWQSLQKNTFVLSLKRKSKLSCLPRKTLQSF